MADFEAGSTVAGFPIIHEGNVGTVIRTGNTPDSFITRSEADGRYPRIYFTTSGISPKDGDILTIDSPREIYIYNGGWRKLYPIDTPALVWGPVQITGYVNSFDGVVNWTAPEGHVVVGEYSFHQNQQEDRRFRFRYRSITL